MTVVAIEDRLVQRTLEGIFVNNYVLNIVEIIRDMVFKPSILVRRELMYPRYQAIIHKSYLSRRDLIDLCWDTLVTRIYERIRPLLYQHFLQCSADRPPYIPRTHQEI